MNAATLTHWVTSTGVSLTLLVGIILIIRKPFARQFGARAAYALWALPILRLIMPAINVPIIKPRLPEIAPNLNDVRFNYMGVDMIPLVSGASPAASSPPLDLVPIIITAWLSGAVLWFAWQLFRQRRYSLTLQANSKELSGTNCGLHNARLAQAMEKLRLRNAPHMRMSEDNSGPLVTGLVRPMIILPANFETHFSPQQQHLALLHEMAHIQRGDLWAAFGALLFRAINWPNPLIHYAAQKFRADQEAACDASVLRLTQSPAAAYAETLIQAAKSAVRPSHEAPLGLTIYHPLKERLMMMKTQTKRASLVSRVAAGALLLGAFAFTAPLTLAAGPDEPEMAGAAKPKNVTKKSYRWIERTDDGQETTKHFELTTKDGVTTAFSIDENGVKTSIDPKTVETEHDTHIEIHEGPHMKMKHHGKPGQYGKVIVKRNHNGAETEDVKAFTFSSAGDIDFDFDFDGDMPQMAQGQHAEIMVETASDLLDGVETDELSSNARRKVEKARKALKEAREAIDAEK